MVAEVGALEVRPMAKPMVGIRAVEILNLEGLVEVAASETAVLVVHQVVVDLEVEVEVEVEVVVVDSVVVLLEEMTRMMAVAVEVALEEERAGNQMVEVMVAGTATNATKAATLLVIAPTARVPRGITPVESVIKKGILHVIVQMPIVVVAGTATNATKAATLLVIAPTVIAHGTRSVTSVVKRDISQEIARMLQLRVILVRICHFLGTSYYRFIGSCKESYTPWHFTVRTLSKSIRFRTRKLKC